MSDLLYVMKASDCPSSLDPTGYLMSEKFDGVRARWKHKPRKFYSSLDNPFVVPQFLIDLMPPDIDCDGEFWQGYQMFQSTVGLVKRKRVRSDAEWSNIRYLVFDLPDIDEVFYRRITHPVLYRYRSDRFCPVMQVECMGREHLDHFFNQVLEHGGEGVMLKHPNSKYEYRRSDKMLKVVPAQKDEATVVSYTEGKGWCEGMVGALVCDWKGQTITIGSGLTKKQRQHPPKLGARITFEYKGLTDIKDVRHGRFIAERNYE